MLNSFPVCSKRTPRGVLVALSLGLWSCAASAAEPPQTPASVDAACPWGRLGDGKGRLVRCLTQSEAERLLAEGPPAVPVAASPSSGPVTSSPASAPAPTARPPSLAGVTPAEPVPPPPDAPAAPGAPGAPAPPEDEFPAEVASVTADQGTLPDATKSLKKALARFSECVQKNGGLTAEKGDVEVRFMVQGRGRAEGVSVKKRRGMSEAAAKCIADVVDRRYVGSPEEPMVGATLQIVVSKKKR